MHRYVDAPTAGDMTTEAELRRYYRSHYIPYPLPEKLAKVTYDNKCTRTLQHYRHPGRFVRIEFMSYSQLESKTYYRNIARQIPW